jgi:hypothetical protein
MVTRGLSDRRALIVVHMRAASLRYVPRPDPDPGLRDRIVALVHRHSRYSAGMIYYGAVGLLQRSGVRAVGASAGGHTLRQREPGAVRKPARREHFARASASIFSGPSAIQRIRTIPGDRHDQYRRNRRRASGSVASARVSVRKTDPAPPRGSARSVHTIFT